MLRCASSFRASSTRLALKRGVATDADGVPVMGAAEGFVEIASDFTMALKTKGYYRRTQFLGASRCAAMREDAERLYGLNRFAASLSVDEEGKQFAKPGVFSTELDASDFDYAPHCLAYTRDVVTTLPGILSEALDGKVSSGLYGTKLAVALPGASYPKHVDNACSRDASGAPADKRWITCIYYLNPNWDHKWGGHLRLYTDEGPLDIAPDGDSLVVFFADRVVHEVLPTTKDDHHQRFALTIWLCADEASSDLCAHDRPGSALREAHFPSSTIT